MSNREDKELQIGLAEMQMDLQIQIAYLFGSLGVEVAFLIGFFQTGFALQGYQTIQAMLLLLMAFLTCFIAYTFMHFGKKIEKVRRQVRRLRKEHAW